MHAVRALLHTIAIPLLIAIRMKYVVAKYIGNKPCWLRQKEGEAIFFLALCIRLWMVCTLYCELLFLVRSFW